MKTGIDVSVHNGVIDWAKVKAAGVEFAIIRAGYGKVISQKDAQFERNYAGATAQGIPVGAYWYSYAHNPAEAAAEALTFIKVIEGKRFEYPVWFDIEEKSALATGRANCSAMCRAFCEEMERHGYWVGIYASRSVIESYIDAETQERYAIWAAEWGSKLRYHGTAAIWQNSETGRVSGINGNVDTDICYVDYPTNIKAAGKNGFAKQTVNGDLIPYIPHLTASECQTYLAWCAAKGAGDYRDTAEDFQRFVSGK